MHEWESLSHVRWDCKYHVVFIPKYRKKVMYGKLRKGVGDILRRLCRQRGVELIEGHAMRDHVHLCLAIPPKFSVSAVIGFLKREERGAHPPRFAGGASSGWAAFLVAWILREHGGTGRAHDPRVHPAAGSARNRTRQVGFQVRH